MASLPSKLVPIISAVLLTVALVSCQSLGVVVDTSALLKKHREMVLPTVVVINTEQGSTGSGVIIDKQEDNYLVLSGWHIVTNQPTVQIAIAKDKGYTYTGIVLRVSEDKDLALIRVRLKEDRPASKLCSREPVMFEEVFAVGTGLAEPTFPTTGIVSNTHYYFEDHPEVRYLHHSAPIAPGNSGGPLFKYENGAYCITGINLRGRPGYPQFSYAVHLWEINSFIRNNNKSSNAKAH